MAKLIDLISEFPVKIDNTNTIPELMEKVLAMPTLSSQEMLSATVKLKKERGLYFWYMTPEGAKSYEKILTDLTKNPQTINYCQTNNEGNYLVYVGVAASDKGAGRTGMKARFTDHLGTGNAASSTMKRKLLKTLYPSVDFKDPKVKDEFKAKYKPEFDKLISKNFRFNYILEDDLNLDENLTVKQAIEKIEKNFLNSCVLYFNYKDVNNDIKPFTFGRNIQNRKK